MSTTSVLSLSIFTTQGLCLYAVYIYAVICIHVQRHVVPIVSFVLCILSIFVTEEAAIGGGVGGGLLGIAIASFAIYAIGVLVAVLCYSSCEGRSEIEM